MLRIYLKIAWRNLIKNKGYSAINIGGLAVGIAVTMLIGLWIVAELSFNTYHENYKKIAQVWQHQTYSGNRDTQNAIPAPLGPELENSFEGDF